MNKIVAKIYVNDKNHLVLENCGREIAGVLYPSNASTNNSFRIGPVVVGSQNIAISKEAISLFSYMISKAPHSGSDVSSLSIFGNSKGEVVVSWIGEDKQEFGIKDARQLNIGSSVKPNLLNKLTLVDNEKLKKYKFNSKELER